MNEAREIDRIVTMALDEDAPWGDLTSETLIPQAATATAELVARAGWTARHAWSAITGDPRVWAALPRPL